MILTRRLEAGRYYDFQVSVKDTKGGMTVQSCSITATNFTTPHDVIFPHKAAIIMVSEVSNTNYNKKLKREKYNTMKSRFCNTSCKKYSKPVQNVATPYLFANILTYIPFWRLCQIMSILIERSFRRDCSFLKISVVFLWSHFSSMLFSGHIGTVYETPFAGFPKRNCLYYVGYTSETKLNSRPVLQ